MAARKTDGLRLLLGLIAGGLALFVINFVMEPVPVAAAPAFALGAAGFLVMRPKVHHLVINLAIAGALVGIYIHRTWHISGESPPPEAGLTQHLVTEGLTGLFAALFCLAIMGLVMKFLEQR